MHHLLAEKVETGLPGRVLESIAIRAEPRALTHLRKTLVKQSFLAFADRGVRLGLPGKFGAFGCETTLNPSTLGP